MHIKLGNSLEFTCTACRCECERLKTDGFPSIHMCIPAKLGKLGKPTINNEQHHVHVCMTNLCSIRKIANVHVLHVHAHCHVHDVAHY